MSLAVCYHGYLSYDAHCMTCPQIKQEELEYRRAKLASSIRELEEWHAKWEKEYAQAPTQDALR